MTEAPNVDLLHDLFHSAEWNALKAEITVCLRNAERDLKRAGIINRDYVAGLCTGYENILNLEGKFKDAPAK